MNFKRITVKLAVAFAILIAVLLAIGWLGLSRMTLMNGNIQEIVDQRWRKVQLSREALRLSALNSRITMQIFLLRDRADIDPLLQQRAANTQSISDLLKQIEAQLDSAKEKALIAAVWTNRIPYVESYKRALDLLLKENAPEAGREMMANIVTPNLIAYHKSWEAFVAHQGERMDQAGEDAEAYYVSARQMVVTLLTISVILATLVAVFVTQGTNREVTQRIQAQQELVEAHAALERRVEERTAELAAEVAERKAAQEKLTEALRAMAAIDAVLDRSCIIVRTDLDGTITHVNDNLCRLAGYDREELIGQNHRILESNQQGDASTQGMWKTVAEGRIWRGEVESRSKGGHAYWVDSTIGPLLDDQGKPRGYMAIRTDITARKEDEAKVAELNRRLVDASRQAGMAEVATGVLHNVGNVLNSVNVSANLVAEKLRKSKGASLGRIASVLQDHEKNLVEFLTKDSKGQHLPALLSSLAETLATEQTSLLAELATLQKNIGHIKDVVTMQQSYAKISAVTETVKLVDLIEDTLRMNAASLAHHDISGIL